MSAHEVTTTRKGARLGTTNDGCFEGRAPQNTHFYLSLGLALALLAGACAPQVSLPQPAATEAGAPAPSASATPTTPAAQATLATRPAVDAGLESQPARPSATPDPNRLPPEQWQEWPVVPAVTGRALEVYRVGLTRDLDRHALSKVGDCQSIREVLLGMYDRPGRYQIPADQPQLAETIEQFSGSFDRDGYGVKGGFNAAAVLSPLWADPDACQPGETPLACELRVHRPVFALISLEVWWNGRTPERYDQYMRQIIEQMMANGTVPILSTKADNVEGDHSINLATARLAYEYDLPLWNWWRAAQALPNKGLDPTRPDGFHLSVESWPERSLTALESVDSLWRGLETLTQEPADQTAAAPTQTPADVSAPEALETLTLDTLTPGEEAAAPALVFDLFARGAEGAASQGLFTLDLTSGAARPLGEPGWMLQAVSPNGRYLLANQGARLALLDRSGQALFELSQNFVSAAQPAALFAADGAALAWAEAGGALRWLPLDGSPARTLTLPETGLVELLPAAQADQLLALAGTCTAPGACERGSLWQLGPEAEPALAPDALQGQRVAADPASGWWAVGLPGVKEMTGVALFAPDGKEWQYPLPGESVVQLAWSPDGARLAVMTARRSNYSGKNFGMSQVALDRATLGTRELPDLDGLNGLQVWSPDGQRLARVATQETETGYRLAFDWFDFTTGASTPIAADAPELASEAFLFVGRLGWLP